MEGSLLTCRPRMRYFGQGMAGLSWAGGKHWESVCFLNFQKCPGGAWRVGGKQVGSGIVRNSSKGWTGLIWETWKIEWLCQDAGSLSLTAEGLVMVSISYGPMKRGTSLGESVHREMSLADSHTFCPHWYVSLSRPAGVPRSGGGPLALWSRRADSAVGDAALIGRMGNSVSFSWNKSGW